MGAEKRRRASQQQAGGSSTRRGNFCVLVPWVKLGEEMKALVCVSDEREKESPNAVSLHPDR